jgi:universal stress protein A
MVDIRFPGGIMREINRILCPVDLSDVSDHAIDHAVLIASWYKSRITALHVLNPVLVPGTEFAVIAGNPATVLSEDEIAGMRDQVARRFHIAAVDVDVLVRTGSPANQILERARSLPAASGARLGDRKDPPTSGLPCFDRAAARSRDVFAALQTAVVSG